MRTAAQILSIAWAASLALGQTAKFIPLGDLPGGEYDSNAYDIAADGWSVAGSSSSDRGYWGESYRWSYEEGMVGLGVIDGHTQNQAGAISPEGGWVVGRTVVSPDHVEAMAWSEGAGMFGLGDLPGGDFDSIARGVSRNGRVIVGSGSTETNGREHGEGFIWTQHQGMRGLGSLPGGDGSSNAYDVSADGRVVVGSADSAEGRQAYRWTESQGMAGLGAIDPDHFSSGATAISNNGQWIVGTSSTGVDDGGGGSTVRQAVLWTPAGDIVGLGWIQDTGARYSFARDVTNDGSMVVGRAGGGGLGDLAFLWTPDDGMRDLNELLLTDYGLDMDALGWTLNHANAISPDGSVIVGLGVNPDGRGEAWMIRLPVPAPATTAPLFTAAALAARRRRR